MSERSGMHGFRAVHGSGEDVGSRRRSPATPVRPDSPPQISLLCNHFDESTTSIRLPVVSLDPSAAVRHGTCPLWQRS